MSGPNADTFQRALKRFKQSISPELAHQFSLCTLEDVRDACRDIQQKHGQEGKLRYMRRIDAFIEAMEQFGKVIEVFVNANEFVCFLWGPVKFMLNIAKAYLDSFDKLLSVYAQVGEAIPGLKRYQTTFEEHPPLATVLEDYYSDILEFHQAALAVFRRPKWKEIFHSTWKTFDSRFRPIIHSLNNRRELLESEKVSATLYEIQKLRRDVSAMQDEQKQLMTQEILEKHKWRVSLVREKLQAPNYQIDQEIASEDRQGYNTGSWIFENAEFRAWSRDDTTDHGVLYVHGIPGAGKTTLISGVIEMLLDKRLSGVNKYSVAYFYFKHNELEKQRYNSLLRAILDQLIDQDPDISDRLYPDMSPIEGTGLRSTKTLEKLVKVALGSSYLSYIILDGLDECAPGEATKSIRWFLSLVDGGLENTTAGVRVLFCGQQDGTLDKMLADRSSISLDSSGHVEDINRYCRDFCQQIREKFDIPLELQENIISRVVDEAHGMFLYARVVLGNLLGQTKLSGVRQEIEPGTFPQGIEKAYERVAIRVFEKSSSAECEDATRILGWVVCAKRLIRWREIQSLFCIDPFTCNVDYEGGRLRATCKDLCGSLVDVHYASGRKPDSEDTIKIVHKTAREYLVQKNWLNIYHNHAKLAIFCSRYLTSKPFTPEIDEEEIIKQATMGYYALQDYAVQYWFDHFRECADRAVVLGQNRFEEVMEWANNLLTSYGLASKVEKPNGTGKHNEVARTLKELPQDGNERNAYFNIELRTISIRKKIEAIQEDVLDPAVQEALAGLHGTTTLFKCSKSWCFFFTAGFTSNEERDQHTDRHNLPFCCPVEDCFAFKLGYDTQFKLCKHIERHHPEPDHGLEFPKITVNNNIWVAIEKGDLATVRALLDSGTRIQKPRPKSGHTALYEATRLGDFGICKLLVERGALINTRTKRGDTALHAAVRAGDLDIVRLLVSQKNCAPDLTNDKAVSPFCEACALGHLEIVKMLFETGHIQVDRHPIADPDCCQTRSGTSLLSPFGYACDEGHLEVVQYLLQHRIYANLSEQDLILVIENSPTLLRLATENTSPLSLLSAIIESPGLLAQLPDLLAPVTKKSPDALLSAIDELTPILLQVFEESPGVFLAIFEKSPTLLSQAYEKSPRLMRTLTSKARPIDDWSLAFSENSYQQVPRVLELKLVYTLYHESSVWGVEFSRCGRYIATGSGTDVQLHDAHSRRTMLTIRHDRNIAGMSLSPDGKYLTTGTKDGLIKIWVVETLEFHREFNTSPDSVTSLNLTLDGLIIASRTIKNTVRLRLVKEYLTMHTFAIDYSGCIGLITSIAVSADAKLVAASSNTIPHDVCIWDVLNGKLLSLLRGPHCNEAVEFVTFSPDSKFILSGSRDKTIRMWDTFKGMCVRTFSEHDGPVLSAAFTPYTNMIISGSSDRTVRIWDGLTGFSQLKLEGHNGPISSISTRPNGDLFATGSRDGRVRIWSYRVLDEVGANSVMKIGSLC